MSILQLSYQAYLESKYEKEIKEFKEVSFVEVGDRIKELKNELAESVLFSFSNLEELKDEYNKYKMILDELTYSTLDLNFDKYSFVFLPKTNEAYKKLKNTIVEGEKIKKNNYDWHFFTCQADSEDTGRYIKEEAEEFIDEEINDNLETQKNDFSHIMKGCDKDLTVEIKKSSSDIGEQLLIKLLKDLKSKQGLK